MAHKCFIDVRSVKQEDIKLGILDCSDPFKINKEDIKLGIQSKSSESKGGSLFSNDYTYLVLIPTILIYPHMTRLGPTWNLRSGHIP